MPVSVYILVLTLSEKSTTLRSGEKAFEGNLVCDALNLSGTSRIAEFTASGLNLRCC
jgi:hypothetical protein